MEQIAKDYPELGHLMGGDRTNVNKLIEQHSFIVTTYNSFKRLNEKIRNRWDYYLIIDEYHKIISDSNYRTDSLHYIYKNMFNYLRFIGLTGTPFGCINNNLLRYNVKLVNVLLNAKFSLIKGNYSIIRYANFHGLRRTNDGLLYHYIKNRISKGTNLIFINDIDLLENIRTKLFEEEVIKKGEYLFFTSESMDNPENLTVVRRFEVPEKIKVIFSTSVMSTGINLKGFNFNNVFIYKEQNLIEIIQFIYRFRDGINNVYDFVPYDESKQSKFDFEAEVKTLTNTYSKIIDNINLAFKKDRLMLKEYITHSSNNLIKNDLIIYDNYEVALNENRIRWSVLSKLHKRAMLDTNIRVEYLQLYGFKKIELPPPDFDNYEVDFKKSRKLSAAHKNVIKESLLLDLADHNCEIVSYFRDFLTKKNASLFNNIPNQHLIKSLPQDSFNFIMKSYDDDLGRNTIKNTLLDFLFFHSTGVSIETAIEMTRKNDRDKLTKAIEFLRLIPHINKSTTDNNSIKKSLHKDILFVQDVYNHLKYRQKIILKNSNKS